MRKAKEDRAGLRRSRPESDTASGSILKRVRRQTEEQRQVTEQSKCAFLKPKFVYLQVLHSEMPIT